LAKVMPEKYWHDFKQVDKETFSLPEPIKYTQEGHEHVEER
jgi:hypothetical protein